jgi:hypothetical protein
VAEILVTAVEVQISMATMTPLRPTTMTTTRVANPEEVSNRVGVLVDLLVRMAKPFFGTRTQVCVFTCPWLSLSPDYIMFIEKDCIYDR